MVYLRTTLSTGQRMMNIVSEMGLKRPQLSDSVANIWVDTPPPCILYSAENTHTNVQLKTKYGA